MHDWQSLAILGMCVLLSFTLGGAVALGSQRIRLVSYLLAFCSGYVGIVTFVFLLNAWRAWRLDGGLMSVSTWRHDVLTLIAQKQLGILILSLPALIAPAIGTRFHGKKRRQPGNEVKN
jgi:hypothetical protein